MHACVSLNLEDDFIALIKEREYIALIVKKDIVTNYYLTLHPFHNDPCFRRKTIVSKKSIFYLFNICNNDKLQILKTLIVFT